MVTTIQLQDETKARLEELGSKGESFDEIVRRLLDEYEAPSEST